MKTALKIIGIILGLFVLLATLWVVNNQIYPFKSVHPNYSDVERAFAKLQFPSDWQQISSSENRGLHGRGCDFLNNAGCFHKSKTFKVPQTTTVDDIKRILVHAGCPGVLAQDITPKGDPRPTIRLNCKVDNGVSFGADITGPKSEVYVSAETF